MLENMSLRYASLATHFYPGNNVKGHVSYQLETAQLTVGVRRTSWELQRGTANDLSNGKEDFDDKSPFHRTVLL